MPSPLLQGGSRRRRRPHRHHQRDPLRRPRRRRTGLWLGALVVVVVAAAGAASWYFWLRHTSHGAAQAAVHRANPRPRPKRPPGPPGIYLPGRNILPVHFNNPPRVGVLFSLDSGEVLWSASPFERVPIASLAKIMSAIIIVDHTRDRELAPVTSEALHYQGQALGELPP